MPSDRMVAIPLHGKKYHEPDCGHAHRPRTRGNARMVPRSEAEAAGYTPAKCYES